MSKARNVVKTSFSSIWLDESGICWVVINPDVVVRLAEMKENFDVQKKLMTDKKLPALIDMRNIKNSTHEARDFAAGKEYSQIVSAVAILESSNIGKIMGNLFINFSKPRFPTILFGFEDVAINWLLQITKENNLEVI